MDQKAPKNPASAASSSSEGAHITDNVHPEGGNLIGRDKTVGGDEVGATKWGGMFPTSLANRS